MVAGSFDPRITGRTAGQGSGDPVIRVSFNTGLLQRAVGPADAESGRVEAEGALGRAARRCGPVLRIHLSSCERRVKCLMHNFQDDP